MLNPGPGTIAIISLGTFVVSLLVSAFGPTGGLQLAIVAAMVPPPLTIPLHAWISSTSALFRTASLWNRIAWRYLSVFAGLTVVGSIVGVSATTKMDARLLEVFVGVAIVSSAIRIFRKQKVRTPNWLSSPALAALSTGFLTIFVGATGPLLFTLMAPRFQDRQELMATHSACLSLQHLSKLALFGSIGVVVFQYPILLGATTLASASGTWLGNRILPRVHDRLYAAVVCFLMVASGTLVIVRALLGR